MESPTSPVSPCSKRAAGQKTLIFLTKGDAPLMENQAGVFGPAESISETIMIYFDIRYDQAEYNFIRGQDNDPTSWLLLLRTGPKENAQFGVQMPME